MEKTRRFLSTRFRSAAIAAVFLPLLLGACGKSGASSPAANLTETDHTVLGEYEDVRAALAADDLRGTQRASAKLAATLKPADSNAPASPMLASAQTIANASALDKARQEFKNLSVQVIQKTNGVKGYYVINCPMTPNGDWVQTNETVSNPYLGKIMHDCGVVKK